MPSGTKSDESVSSLPSKLRRLGGSGGALAAADSWVSGAGSQIGGPKAPKRGSCAASNRYCWQCCRLSGWPSKRAAHTTAARLALDVLQQP